MSQRREEFLKKLAELQLDLARRAKAGDSRAEELLHIPIAQGVEGDRKYFVLLREYYLDLSIAEQYGLDLDQFEF